MKEASILRLEYLLKILPDLLVKTPEVDWDYKLSPDKWSKKEILGHLIDSATHNHQRFVRLQFEHKPTIVYDQVNWNRCSHHNQANYIHLIEFWSNYNRHLISILQGVSAEDLKKECNIGNDVIVTLDWLINDYVRHLEHHLKQIVEY